MQTEVRRGGIEWERWLPAAGILFVVLFIVGFVLDNTPNGSDSTAKWISYYAKSGNRTQLIITAYLLLVAALAFLAFVMSLRNKLRPLEGEGHAYSTLIMASGILFIGAIFVAGSCIAAVPAGITFGSNPVPGGDVDRFIPQLGYGILLVPGMFSLAVLIACTSVASLRLGVLPQWVAWLGFVATVAALFAAAFFPLFVPLLWVLVASIVLILRPPAAAIHRVETS
jgi:hypothetical protein